MSPVRRIAIGLCVSIAFADLVQIVWLHKGAGALGGVVIYGLSARGLILRRRVAAWLVGLMPIVPLAVLSGLFGGEHLVDKGMIAVAFVQVAAGLAAMGVLVEARANRTR